MSLNPFHRRCALLDALDSMAEFPHGGLSMNSIFGAKILLVDDQEPNLAVLERLLRRSGYSDITATTDPRLVVTIFETEPPDIVLLDLAMPEVDGFMVMEQLQQWIGTSTDSYLPVLVLTADASKEARERSLAKGARDFLTKPFDATEVTQRIKNLLEARLLHLRLRAQNDLLDQRVKQRTADLWATVGQLEQSEARLRSSQEETITRLSIAAEFRDDETAQHIERMSHYCSLLAGLAGEDKQRCDLMRVASRMHDVGKIGTPDNILRKPGPLTARERSIMQEHTEIGYRILARSESELLQVAAAIALTHHERIDGTGYPRQLTEDEIPLEGRIAAVADVFDALITDRVYRDAYSLNESIQIMKGGRGTQFDLGLLDLFLEKLPEFLKIKESLDNLAVSKTYVPGSEAG
jgi:putative two-component system response regulator